MDKQPASLIDASQSSFLPNAVTGIQHYNVRQGQVYLSPAYIIESIRSFFGVPYWMNGLAMQTTNNMYISAPEPLQKSIITHRTDQISQSGQYAIGAAPTSGIYTGVEDHC